MKIRSITMLPFFILAALALQAADSGPVATADAVVTTMLQRDAQRRVALERYHGMRRYTLENERMQKHAEMLTQVESDADGTKHFEVVDEQGWKAAYKHVFRKMLESEAEASRPELRVKTCLCSANYEFHMVGLEPVEGRPAFVVDIEPRRHEERLFAGRIWIDADDYALVKAEGKPAKTPSFWIRSVHFVHTYHKAGQYWFPSATESVSEVRIFGTTKVTISYFNYSPQSQRPSETASVQLQNTAAK